jgi:hypothetical protein
MFDSLRRLLATSSGLTDAVGDPIRFVANRPALTEQIAECERVLNRTLIAEFAQFLAEWKGVTMYRTHAGYENRVLVFMGTHDLMRHAGVPYVAVDEDEWPGSSEVFPCAHALATDGADYLGYDLAAGTFIDMQGYVPLQEVHTRVLARNLEEFLEKFAAKGFSYFWVELFKSR